MKYDASYIIQCRANWFLKIYPSDDKAKSTQEYAALIKIAKTYFDRGDYEEFAGYFMEGQYLIPLWTAHLILEYGEASPSLKEKCIAVITDYTENPLALDVAIGERKWLENYNASK